MKVHVAFAALKIINFILQPMIWHLRKRGIMTFYWVCNTKEEYERAIKYGACGVMTDEPYDLLNYIA
jgi:hypothetical protein